MYAHDKLKQSLRTLFFFYCLTPSSYKAINPKTIYAMNIPNNYTNKKAELFRAAIITELKDRVIEFRVITITETVEDAAVLGKEIALMHDAILIQEQMRPIRPVGSCSFPMIIVQN